VLHKLLAIAAFWMLMTADNSEAFFGVGKIVHDPANFQQNILTAVRMADSLVNEAQMIANQLQQYNDLLRQGKQITDGQWSNIQDLLWQVESVARKGNAVAYTMDDLDGSFRQAYPGYQPPSDWNTDYRTWTEQGLDTIRGVLNGIGIQHGEMASEQDRLRAIQSLSDGAVGRMQALQVGNMLASEQATQMAKLRQLIMMQTNAQSVYYAHQINTDAAREARVQQWLQAPRPEVPAYGTTPSAVTTLPTISP
jgi:P-type conjugative transfer protein TrbJ